MKFDSDGFKLYDDESQGVPEEGFDLSASVVAPAKESGSGGSGSAGAKRSRASRYTLDDIGNSNRLVDLYGKDMRWNNGTREWLVWDGRRWSADDHEAVRRAMTIPGRIRVEAGEEWKTGGDEAEKKHNSWAEQSSSSSRIEGMLKLSRSQKGIAVDPSELNGNRRLINCRNGVVVLSKSGAEFRPVRREDLCTKVAGTGFIDGSSSVLWNDFLDRFLPDYEVRDWAQRIAGYSMLGQNPERKIIFFWGGTSSGKSTFAEVVKAVMGDYAGTFNLSLFRDNQDERSRPDLIRAMDQRIIIASETSSVWRLHTDQIKRGTGKDSLQARMPHSGIMIDRVPDYTPWIVTNNPPTIDGADLALYRRLLVVPFYKTIDEGAEDKDFIDRLKAEDGGGLPAVLSWLIEGWNRYCEDGLGKVPAKAAEWTMRLREQLSDLDIFLSEETVPETEAQVPATDLYDRYVEWADRNGLNGRDRLTGTAFGKALTGKGFPGKVRKVGGKSVRLRYGLALRIEVKK